MPIADEAQSMVFEAAGHVPAGKGIYWQMRQSSRELGYSRDGVHWRVRAAWYGEAECWSAKAFEELRKRFSEWKAKRKRLSDNALDNVALVAALKYETMADRLEQQDESFHRVDIDNLRNMADRLRCSPETDD